MYMFDKIVCGSNELYLDVFGNIIGLYDLSQDVFYMKESYKRKYPSTYRYLKNIKGINIKTIKGKLDSMGNGYV